MVPNCAMHHFSCVLRSIWICTSALTNTVLWFFHNSHISKIWCWWKISDNSRDKTISTFNVFYFIIGPVLWPKELKRMALNVYLFFWVRLDLVCNFLDFSLIWCRNSGAYMPLNLEFVARSHRWSLYLRILGKGLQLKTTSLFVFFLWVVKSCKTCN